MADTSVCRRTLEFAERFAAALATLSRAAVRATT
jgi:hypothetical protein